VIERAKPRLVRNRWPFFTVTVADVPIVLRAPSGLNETLDLAEWYRRETSEGGMAVAVAAQTDTSTMDAEAMEALRAEQRAGLRRLEGAIGWVLRVCWADPAFDLDADVKYRAAGYQGITARTDCGIDVVGEVCDAFGLSYGQVSKLVAKVVERITPQRDDVPDMEDVAEILSFGSAPPA
jgi:hypothetical protein